MSALDDIALTVGYAWCGCVLAGVAILLAMQARRLYDRLAAGRRAERAEQEPVYPTERLYHTRRLGIAIPGAELYWTTSMDSGLPTRRYKEAA